MSLTEARVERTEEDEDGEEDAFGGGEGRQFAGRAENSRTKREK